jgi:hypothetical protein
LRSAPPCQRLASTAERAPLLTRRRVFGDKLPVDLEPEAGLVAGDQLAVVQMRVLVEEPVMQRVGVRPAMRLDPERAARHRLGEPAGAGRKRPR